MKEGDALVPMAPDKVADPLRYEERDELTDEITRVIDVDKDDAAFILGRGGATIQRVRAESGAKVKLHDCAPGAATRFLELGGAIDKVQAARALVVRCLERVVLPPEDDQGF